MENKKFLQNAQMKTPVLDMGIDHTMTRLNSPNKFNKTRRYVCEGVFCEDSHAITHHLESYVCRYVEVDEEFAKLFDFEPYRFKFEDIKDITVKILSVHRRLRSATCLGWSDWEDKSKDPNWFQGDYIFPDGNKYGITLKSGTVYVYPGESVMYRSNKQLPLCEFKIDMHKWAYDKIIEVVEDTEVKVK